MYLAVFILIVAGGANTTEVKDPDGTVGSMSECLARLDVGRDSVARIAAQHGMIIYDEQCWEEFQ